MFIRIENGEGVLENINRSPGKQTIRKPNNKRLGNIDTIVMVIQYCVRLMDYITGELEWFYKTTIKNWLLSHCSPINWGEKTKSFHRATLLKSTEIRIII